MCKFVCHFLILCTKFETIAPLIINFSEIQIAQIAQTAEIAKCNVKLLTKKRILKLVCRYRLSDYTSVKSLFLTGAHLDIPGLTLSDLKFRILGVFMQLFPGYAGGIQCFNQEH